MGKVIYLHFSGRRPKGEPFGLFSVACYADKEFKKLITKEVVASELWEDCQRITSIQSFHNVLDYIYKNQAELKRVGVTHIMLVTSNKSLMGWITQESKNRYYTQLTSQCMRNFRFGQNKEITLGVGLMDAVEKEKSKQYCLEKYVDGIDEIREKLKIDGGEADKKTNYVQPAELDDSNVRTIFDVINSMAPESGGDIEEL